ncbi:hypothetical protein RhiirC2_775331 [Rhizophagus irregularis]|uniref:Uncharacterized protein n=1 Tax=Rhizophagus irregularis TaxID=588596 RepID=A0A2N1NJE8_9GLOM|nr:hypothetical protein RhiirC2_775331 [Rhizophagus irregularis]
MGFGWVIDQLPTPTLTFDASSRQFPSSTKAEALAICIAFAKVKAHSGIRLNEEGDEQAKIGLSFQNYLNINSRNITLITTNITWAQPILIDRDVRKTVRRFNKFLQHSKISRTKSTGDGSKNRSTLTHIHVVFHSNYSN